MLFIAAMNPNIHPDGLPKGMFYKLGDDGKTPVEVTSLADAMSLRDSKANRLIKSNVISRKARCVVSTIFTVTEVTPLVMKMVYKDTRKYLFETRVFGGTHHNENRQYATYEEAVAGHNIICNHILECDGQMTVLQRIAYGFLCLIGKGMR